MTIVHTEGGGRPDAGNKQQMKARLQTAEWTDNSQSERKLSSHDQPDRCPSHSQFPPHTLSSATSHRQAVSSHQDVFIKPLISFFDPDVSFISVIVFMTKISFYSRSTFVSLFCFIWYVFYFIFKSLLFYFSCAFVSSCTRFIRAVLL